LRSSPVIETGPEKAPRAPEALPRPEQESARAFATTVLDSGPEGALVAPEALPRSIRERFEDIRFLGQGGMGAGYRAKDQQLHRDVVLKILPGQGPLASERVLREARAQARVDHEHVCKIHEVSVAEGRPYIVMEYIDGEPLSAMGERLTLEEKV